MTDEQNTPASDEEKYGAIPGNFTETHRSETHVAGYLTGDKTEDWRANTVVVDGSSTAMITPSLIEYAGMGEGPLAGMWPVVFTSGRTYDVNGQQIESTVAGMQGVTVLLFESPGRIIDLARALLAIVLDQRQFNVITDMINASMHQREHPDYNEMTVLEQEFMQTQPKVSAEKGAEIEAKLSALVEAGIVPQELADEMRSTLRFLNDLGETEEKSNDEGEEIR